MVKVFFFLSASPYPIDDGIKKINDNLIRTFLKLGYKVSLAVPQGSEKRYKNVEYSFYEKKRAPFSILMALFCGKPLYFPLYFDKSFRIDKKLYDIVFYDFYPMTQYYEGYRHEVFMMPDSMKELALSQVKNTPSVLHKLYHLLNYLLAKSYNGRISRLKKLYVSDADIKIDNLSNSHFFKIPADEIDTLKYEKTKPDMKELMFRGVMSFEPNITAIRTFYDEIFTELVKRYPNVVLKVVGKDPSKELKASLPQSTRFTGFVDDVFEEMSMSGIHIVPMVSGTGVKTKLLDSIALKRLVFATPKAINGIFEDVEEARGNGIIIYQDKEEFFYYFDKLVNNEIDYKLMTEQAYRFIKRNNYEKKIEELIKIAGE